MARIILQPALVLHARPFRDTSLLLDLFTVHYGRISAVARGARGSKSKIRGLLLPFVPLLISWSGKAELVTITKIEPSGCAYNLSGNNLLSGLYLNELLVRLLHRHDPYPNIYQAYQNVLINLQNRNSIQASLRLFEKQLLAEIGYGLQLLKDCNGEAISADINYYYEHGVGFVRIEDCGLRIEGGFAGKSLLALANDALTDPVALKDAKRVMRIVLAHLLNEKPLKSRELFNCR